MTLCALGYQEGWPHKLLVNAVLFFVDAVGLSGKRVMHSLFYVFILLVSNKT
jgi:hypothetical protein